ncbi:flagellar filament capping protein FliD [Legionella fairfieldensis]|uniref:flagellar filament capping protein FliD n=1 Tax=Legionella fairfieldensis TaxID=45064 RepID=UPI00056D81D5|nr:flagellar filament capping protein FliD [Legionella fairfieldensis]
MPGISSPGIGSGLDVKSIVESLVKADITPAKDRLDRQEAKLTTQLSAMGQIKSSLSKLQSSLAKLSDPHQYHSLTTNVSDTKALTASITDNTVAGGDYQIQIQQLATQHSLASAPIANSTTPLGSGTITIDFGTYSSDNTIFTANPDQDQVTITVLPGQDNLLAIQNAINNSNSSVRASIVQDNTGARLTLVSTNTGEASAMKISVVDNDGNNTDSSGLSALAYDPTAGVNSLTQTVAAKDSQVYINGLLLTQSSNQLKTAIEGVNLNLLTAQPGITINLSVTNNKSQVTTMVNEFIKQYNETMTTLNSLTSYNPETKQSSPMQGDSGIRSLKFNLSNLIGQALKGVDGPIDSLMDIGIKTNLQGTLVMDGEIFNKALADNYEAIVTLFAKTAKATDPAIHVTSAGQQVPAGTYRLMLTDFIPGNLLAGTIDGVRATSPDGVKLNGTGNFSGLGLTVLGGSSGDRGSITITDGLAVLFNQLIDNYINPQGNLPNRINQINTSLEDIDNDRQQLALKAITLSQRYTKQFSALDTLLSSMQATSEFLSRQLDNLPSINPNKRS